MQKLNISHEYDTDLWNEGVYDRQGLDIAWICACLNPLRHKTERKMELYQKNFKLSPFYILFFHLYDSSCYFIDNIIASRMLPISDVKLQKTLLSPVSYSGNWFDFCRVVVNHGVVPLHAMPGGEIHAHRTELLTVLSSCLAYHARLLRECADAEVPAERKLAISAVSDILVSYLGAPPETFNWNYKTLDGKDKALTDISPVEFYQSCCDFDVDRCVVVFDESLKGKVPEIKGKTLFNTPEWMASFTAVNIEGRERMVVVGADTRHQANKMLGILDTDFNDNTGEFGADVTMSKKDSVDYHRIAVTDYLALDGMTWDKVSHNPLRFKAQDSCGADTGADGHYTMSYDWFCKYVLFMVGDPDFAF
jgi:bleomycin hydrolase